MDLPLTINPDSVSLIEVGHTFPCLHVARRCSVRPGRLMPLQRMLCNSMGSRYQN